MFVEKKGGMLGKEDVGWVVPLEKEDRFSFFLFQGEDGLDGSEYLVACKGGEWCGI